jgi:hypothetical protein
MMAWVDDADVQIHLPVDSLKVEEVPDDLARAKEDALRIVRGYLASVLESTTIAGWTDPDSTPPEIRAATGRFAAALIYRLRFGQSTTADPAYAQNKYKEAMEMLIAILNGEMTITDPVTGEPIDDNTTDFDNTWFLPNDATTDTPKFLMGGRF